MGGLAALAIAVIACVGCRFEPSPIGGGDGGGDPPPGDGAGGSDDGAPEDGPLGLACNQATCATVGGTCTGGKCVVDVDGNGKFTCPTGLYCAVTCDNANDTCKAGVDCTRAIGCDITCGASENNDTCMDGPVECPATGPCNVTCMGDHACRNFGVQCGAGRCDVRCIGKDACQNTGVRCNESTECIAECTGDNACQNGGVGCGLTGTCDVQCNGVNACASMVCTGAPATCNYNCCGSSACGPTSPPCGGTCTETNDGCI